MRRVGVVLGAMMLVASCAQRQPAPESPHQSVSPTVTAAYSSKLIQSGGWGSTGAPRAKTEASPPTYDWIKWSWVMCDAGWQDNCSWDDTIEAVQGYQVCKALYTVTAASNSQSYSVTPTEWYTNDSENPPRFRAEIFHIEAHGSHNVLNQYGSQIRLANIGIRMIAAEANNYQRYLAGCDMPPH